MLESYGMYIHRVSTTVRTRVRHGGRRTREGQSAELTLIWRGVNWRIQVLKQVRTLAVHLYHSVASHISLVPSNLVFSPLATSPLPSFSSLFPAGDSPRPLSPRLSTSQQVHPDFSISKTAMSNMNSLVYDLFERLACEVRPSIVPVRLTLPTLTRPTVSKQARDLAQKSKHSTMMPRDVQTASKLILPGELGESDRLNVSSQVRVTSLMD